MLLTSILRSKISLGEVDQSIQEEIQKGMGQTQHFANTKEIHKGQKKERK